ncbi:MAG: hypothetical protein AAF735_08590 [Myxococcota bacterium]
MRTEIRDASALLEISPQSLVAFARSEGWQRVDDYGSHSDVFSGSALPEIIIPRTRHLGDYATVVWNLIQAFSSKTRQDELTTHRALIGADHDVVRVRALGTDDNGTVKLDSGVEIIRQSKEMLLSAACATGQRRKVYRASANKEATEYMSRVRLGQTEHGSFVVTLLSPVAPALVPQTNGEVWAPVEDEPEERRITRRLMEALRAARNATERAQIDGIKVFEKAVSSGVSANLCESLASMIEKTDDLEIGLTWARTRPTPETQSRVSFSYSDAQTLREAGRLFKEKEPRESIELIGPVTILKRDEQASSGFVTLRTIIDNQPKSVKLTLDGSAYSVAIEAHESKNPILATGDLVRDGDRWVMKNPAIELLESEDDQDDQPMPSAP